MSSEKWMYVGCIVIVASNALQFVSTLWPSFLPSWHLALVGIVISTASVIFTILQARKSAIETQQQFDYEEQKRISGDWDGTQEGYIHRNLSNPDSRLPLGR